MSATPGNARRVPPSRPTTPLRPPSRSSLRTSTAQSAGKAVAQSSEDGPEGVVPPIEKILEPQMAELADGIADLEANLMHLQLQHESLTRFTESFAAFLYGMEVNAFCVDFPEVSATNCTNACVIVYRFTVVQ